MKKLLPVVIALLFLASCTNSKIYTARTCMVCLNPTDGILVLPLIWEPTFRVLSVAEKNQIERQIISLLNKEGFQKVEILDNLDYQNYTKLAGVIRHGITKGTKNLVKSCSC